MGIAVRWFECTLLHNGTKLSHPRRERRVPVWLLEYSNIFHNSSYGLRLSYLFLRSPHFFMHTVDKHQTVFCSSNVSGLNKRLEVDWNISGKTNCCWEIIIRYWGSCLFTCIIVDTSSKMPVLSFLKILKVVDKHSVSVFSSKISLDHRSFLYPQRHRKVSHYISSVYLKDTTPNLTSLKL